MREDILPGYDRISDISSAFGNHGRVPKNILDYAADRGTHIHELIYDLMNDVFVKDERYLFCGKPIQGYMDSFWRFWKPVEDNSIKILQEERLYDDFLMITGQIDWLGILEEKLTIVDWKATSAVGKHWLIQATGYHQLCNQNGYKLADRILFVRLDKDGGYPEVTEYVPHYEVFKSALELYRLFLKDQKSNLEME